MRADPATDGKVFHRAQKADFALDLVWVSTIQRKAKSEDLGREQK
jgi:hypothetical protein